MARAYPRRGGIDKLGWLLLIAAVPATSQYEDGGRSRAATFDTLAASDYGDATAALRALMRHYPTHRGGAQHFCAVGYRYRSGERNAYVTWREGRREILWEGGADPLERTNVLWMSRVNLDLDLDTDVMPDGRFNGSTYMIFRHEQRDVERDCARAGRRYVLALPRGASVKP